MSRFKKSGVAGTNQVSGQWSTIQLTPDLVTDERINIGVALIDNNGLVHTRFASNLEKLNCLYPGINVEAYENSLSALNTIMEGAVVEDISQLDLYENILLGEPKPTKGESEQQILNRLFKQMVPIGIEPKQNNKREKFKVIRTSELRAKVFKGIQDRLGAQSKNLIHAKPWQVKVPGENKTISLDLPLRNDAKCKAGTIVSGWYASDDKVKLSLYQSALDIRTAMDYISDEEFGFFMLRPDAQSGLNQKTLDKIDFAIDDQAERLHRLGVQIGVSDQTEELIKQTSEWVA